MILPQEPCRGGSQTCPSKRKTGAIDCNPPILLCEPLRSLRLCGSIVFSFLILFLTACAPTRADETTSLWGPITDLGEAVQADSPALWIYPDRVTTAWIGADDTGTYQYMRSAAANMLTDITRLPLPPVYPHAQGLFPAAEDHTHILWLDTAYDAPLDGLLLWSSTITPDLNVERGPVRVTQPGVFRYAAAPAGDGALWVVWSGGLPAEPSLALQMIDSVGRPRLAREIVTSADYPALARASDNTLYLYWISALDGDVYRGVLQGETITQVRSLLPSVWLERGDRLAGFSAGFDESHAYLLWNIVRISGEVETWIASAALSDDVWSAPARLGIDILPTGEFITGFNSGTSQAVKLGTSWLRWGALLPGQFENLAIAGQVNQALGIVYLHAGEVRGWQTITSLEGQNLIGTPSLHTDVNLDLYLAWSQPTPEGHALLRVTSTR